MKITNFTEAQDALRPYYENTRRLYSLDTIKTLMAVLGNPQNDLKIVHVAGTSGKTSTCYYTAALLQAQGLKVGLTVSPHVDHINERLQINGESLLEAEYCELLGEFMDAVTASGVKPSYFELLSAFAYLQFARRGVDYAVIEVGMGGQMDATNVIDRQDKVCVITDIGLDHTEFLGDTLDKIAWFKAGIITPRNEVFMYRQGDDVMDVVTAVATTQSATLHALDDSANVVLAGLPPFQQRNLGLAVQAVNYVNERDGRLPLTTEQIAGVSKIVVPARLERLHVDDKIVVIDGSHNQQKLQALLKGMAELYPDQAIIALCGFVSGNDERWQGGLTELFTVAKHLIFTTFHGEQDMPKSSVSTAEIVKFCTAQGFSDYEVVEDPANGYAKLLARPEPVLLVTGSFYLLNHIRPLVQETV